MRIEDFFVTFEQLVFILFFSCVKQKWAFEKEQKYKVGNFVLEEVKIMRYHW